MNELHKLMMKKKEKGDTLSDAHGKAKSGILQELIDEMMGMDGEKVKGLKKVTVASNSPSGLAKGLDKAKEIVGDKMLSGHEDEEEMPEHEDMESEDEESPEHESEESPEMEASEHEDGEEDVDSLKKEIELLKEKLAKHNLA